MAEVGYACMPEMDSSTDAESNGKEDRCSALLGDGDRALYILGTVGRVLLDLLDMDCVGVAAKSAKAPNPPLLVLYSSACDRPGTSSLYVASTTVHFPPVSCWIYLCLSFWSQGDYNDLFRKSLLPSREQCLSSNFSRGSI